MSKDQLVLRITKDASGKEVELDNMTLDEVVTFKRLLDSFLGLAKVYDKNSDTRISIRKGSAQMALETSSPTIELIKSDFSDIFNNKSKKNQTVIYCKEIQKILTTFPFQYEFDIKNSQGQKTSVLTEFTRKQKFYTKREPKTKRISELEFIQGELIDLGGKKINFHITPPNSDYALVIDCKSKEEARRVRNYVYSEAYILVHTKKSKKSKTIREFLDVYTDEAQFEEIKKFYSSFQSLEGHARYMEFHNFIYSELKKTNDLEKALKKIRKYIRLFDNSWTESGQLRTILVSLKSFRKNEILEETLNRITNRLKELTGQNKI